MTSQAVFKARFSRARFVIGMGDGSKIKAQWGAGGLAFPSDYDWTCPRCGRECRAFELVDDASLFYGCGYCQRAAC